jgi:predicted nucleic acid-binding protein
LVIDGSAATAVCLSEGGFELVPNHLQAPVLLRSEVLAAIQGMQWRREISENLAELAVDRLLAGPIRLVRRTEVYREARRLAAALGWAKTYDAEYLALARLSGDTLLTVDHRLARRVGKLVQIVLPEDL